MAQERPSTPHQDIPNLGILFGKRSYKFDQFGTMQGEMHRDSPPLLQIHRDAYVFAIEVGNPVSLN